MTVLSTPHDEIMSEYFFNKDISFETSELINHISYWVEKTNSFIHLK